MEKPQTSKKKEKSLNNGIRDKPENIKFKEANFLPDIKNENHNYIKYKKISIIEEDNLINEQIYLLQYEWDELGITPEYRNSFMNNIKDIPKTGKKDVIIQEKNNLKKFGESLIDLKKEITNREKNIQLLHNYDNSLENNFDKKDIINDTLQEIITIIKKLRKNAINIVTKILNINKLMNKYINSGKIDIYRIKQKYLYDPDYLNKMKDDLLFLQESNINKYIEMNNSKVDQFLTNCESNHNKFKFNNKIIIPIPDEHMKLIKELRYKLLQEEISMNSNEKNENNCENNNYNKNARYGNNDINNFHKKKFLNKIRNKSYVSKSVKKEKRKEIYVGNINISKKINTLKNIYGQKNYDILFLNKNTNSFINLADYIKSKKKNNNSKKTKNFILSQNKIIIEREEINNNKKNVNNINKYQTEYNYSNIFENQNQINNVGDLRNEKVDEMEEFIKYKKIAIEEENNRIKLEKDVDNLQIKLKEMSEKIRNYEKEMKKMRISKNNESEKELFNQIDNLDEDIKDKNDDKKDNLNENILIEKINYLQENLKKEKNLREIKEKEIEEMKIRIKNDDEKNNKEKEKNEHNKMLLKIKLEKKKNEEEVKQKIDNNKIIEEQKKEYIEEKERIKEEISNKENLINNLNEENYRLQNEKNKIENEYNLLKEEKTKIEDYNNKLKEENENIQKNYNNLNEKLKKIEKDYILLKDENKNLKSKIENYEKDKGINRNKRSDYKIDFFKGNLSNLVNSLMEKISIEKIPNYLQRAFMLNDSIFNEEYYFKGIFPKIILSSKEGEENNINGLCSVYYESNEDINENPILRINSIFVMEDSVNQIIKMIDYIKKNMRFKRLEIYLLYDKEENKFIPNKEAKELFQKKLDFKWLCVVRDEKLQQRYIKLYYNKENESQDNTSLIKNNNFYMDNLTVITINSEKNSFLLKNMINHREDNVNLFKANYNKFIDPNPIYSLVKNNPLINKQCLNESKIKELNEIEQKLWRFVKFDVSWNEKEEEKKQIKEIKFDLDNSIYKQIEKLHQKNSAKLLCDLYKKNISVNFESIYSILIDDIYYNKISSDKIKIFKEKKTNSLFFLIPSNDNTVLFYISEVNKKLKELLINNNKNIYEQFLEFQPSIQKEILEFSISSFRDITYIPQAMKSSFKTIYIPTFSIDTHLFSYKFKDIEKKINISKANSDYNISLSLTSIDEYLNVKFIADDNIENSFTILPVEDTKNNIIIKNSLIIGIFDNDIINNDKLPLLQFLYVTKDHFITKKKD